MTHLLEFLYPLLAGAISGAVIYRVIIFLFWPITPNSNVNDELRVLKSRIDGLENTVGLVKGTQSALNNKIHRHSDDIHSIKQHMSKYRPRTNLTPERLDELDKEVDTILSSDTTLKESAPYTAPQQSIPDQLYYFKEIDSSLDDAFSDVTGDRLYMTESGVVTIDAFEKANEKYLARYTAPGKVLKYEWTYLGNGIHGLVRDKRFRAQCIHGKDFRFHYKDVSSIKYPEMLDAMFAAEYYYDNYIKH